MFDAIVLWLTAVITIGFQLSFFAIAYWNQFDKLTDLAGGSNFFINAIVALLVGGAPYTSKRIVATVCVCVWAARLSIFLLVRVLKAGEDKRFDEMRESFLRFLSFWIFQMIWVWNVGLSVTLLNASEDETEFGSRPGDIVGLVMWLVGFLVEAVSDQQKFYHRFHAVAEQKRTHPEKASPLLDTGLWQFSRQPNYFGEIFLWWGMFVLCLPADPSLENGISYASLVSPLLTTLLLLFLSGIPLAEQSYQKRYLATSNTDQEARDAFIAYRLSTSPLIPMPKSIYRRLPLWFKRVFLFEFAMYETELWKKAVAGEGTAVAAVAGASISLDTGEKPASKSS